MAMRQKSFRVPKSIAGAALATLGAFLCYENLAAAAAQLQHDLGALPTLLLAAARLMHVDASGHQHFLQAVTQHLLLSCWPLLLVLAGTACLQRTSAAEIAPHPHEEYFPRKTALRVDLMTHRSSCN
jgi:hypothetical protein